MAVPAVPRSWTRPLIHLIQRPWGSWLPSNTWARPCCHWSPGVCVWILWEPHWSLLPDASKLSPTSHSPNLKIMQMPKETRCREFLSSWLAEDFNFLAYSQQSIYQLMWSCKCVIRIPHALIITLVGIKVIPVLYRSLTKHNNWTRNPYVRQS